jgi:hypothetical protein
MGSLGYVHIVLKKANELNAVAKYNSAESLLLPFFVDYTLDNVAVDRQNFDESIWLSLFSNLSTDHKFFPTILFRPSKPFSKVRHSGIDRDLPTKNQAAEVYWIILLLTDIFHKTLALSYFKDSHATSEVNSSCKFVLSKRQ